MRDARCAEFAGVGRCSHRIPHPASRIPPRDQIIHQSRKRIEADHIRSIRNKIRERVDVVEVVLTVPIIYQIFDAADIELDPCGNTLDLPNNLARRSEEHTSELQSQFHLVCRLLLEKKKKNIKVK